MLPNNSYLLLFCWYKERKLPERIRHGFLPFKVVAFHVYFHILPVALMTDTLVISLIEPE